MVHDLLDEDAWCYWVVSVGTLLSFVGIIAACICSCRRNENKSEFLGLPGMVTLTHSDSEAFHRIPTSDLPHSTQDSVDNTKRTSTANRSLPDIPKDRDVLTQVNVKSVPQDVVYEMSETSGDPSELYATVQHAGEEFRKDDELQSNSDFLSQDDSVNPYTSLKPTKAAEEHPYAQVQNVHKTDGSQRNKNSTQSSDNLEPSTSQEQKSNPVAPPRTRKSSSHNSLLNAEAPVVEIQAATAISGGIQANQDLPYMTPLILMSLPQPPQQQDSRQLNYSGDSQDSKGYTSISVREPLANIIAQTKGAHQQRQGGRPLTDPHYATVSDDSDEMYAAIDEQDKVYTSGSETYAQIQPMIAEPSRADYASVAQVHSRGDHDVRISAPQPPSVDSLRYVAHAHSRQASSSSATSSVANPSSPKPEKRQANSPLPPPPEKTMDLYAQIDKSGKNEDRTRASVTSVKSLEDMYAKVMKKKKDIDDNIPLQVDIATLSISSASHSEHQPLPMRKPSLEASRASWSSHDSVEIQKKDLRDMDCKYSRTSSEALRRSSLETSHGYEVVDTKKLTPQAATSDDNVFLEKPKGDVGPAARNGLDYASNIKQRQVSNASSEDPGYERVRVRRRVNDFEQDSEPNYESMPHDSIEPNYASVCRPGESDYETVTHGDPNYESVQYKKEEPPYEQVNSFKSDEDGYTKVNKKKHKSPDYEKLNDYKSEQRSTDTDDDQYVHV